MLKEPLLHFLLAGGVMFGVYGWSHDKMGEDSKGEHEVRITAGQVEWLKQTWSRQWGRPPNGAELQEIVAGYLREELLAREAKELGLDKDDTVIRRRLAQKMEFLVQDIAQLNEPPEDELRRLYDTNQVRYQTPGLISFQQIFYKNETAARQGLGEVATRRTNELGDRTLLERKYVKVDKKTVSSLFGPLFAEKVFTLDPGRWYGPVSSGYGFHLLRLSERIAPQPRPFDKVRSQVLEEWRRGQQAKANEQVFAGLLKKYDVIVEESVQPLFGPLAEVVR